MTHMQGPSFAEVCPKVDYEAQGNEIAVLGSEIGPNCHESQMTSAKILKSLTRKKR